MSEQILHNNNNNNNDGSSSDSPTDVDYSKEEILLDKNSMPEDDPNGNTLHDAREIRWGPQHAGAKLLASQYTKGKIIFNDNELKRFFFSLEKRFQEIISMLFSIMLMIYNFYFICRYFEIGNCYLIIPAACKFVDLIKKISFSFILSSLLFLVLGILTADLASGIVHWSADTWGSVDMPLIGRHFLRPFREHHIDPTSITRHDFIETNGDNFAVTIPYLLYMAYKFTYFNEIEIRRSYNFDVYMFLLAIFASMTNQVRIRSIFKMKIFFFQVPQMVTYVFRFTLIHRSSPKVSHYSPKKTSSNSSR